jgi:hypothetical protein
LIYDDNRDHAFTAHRWAEGSSGDTLNAEQGVRSRGFNGAERSWNGQLVSM